MKAQKKTTGQSGFTLLETIMAMAIFTVGILGLFGMQSAAIKENLSANAITSGSIWAADRVERLLGLEYTHADLAVTGACTDLPESAGDLAGWPADKQDNNNAVPLYTVYWAVAKDCLLTDIPDAGSEQEEQKPKYIRVIVTKTTGGGEEVEMAVFDYIKQNTKND
jgi:prepilin-type N-terminal cleavage/methylation domain-containing protein